MDTEILIIGSGMVGMSLAHQLKKDHYQIKSQFLKKKMILEAFIWKK